MKRIEDIFKSNTAPVLFLAPMEPITVNPILRELMAAKGAQVVIRPKIQPQHLIKSKQWQYWQSIKQINKLSTPSGEPIYDGIQLLCNLKDPYKKAIEWINHNAQSIGVSFIDLNLCCPGHKVRKEYRGGELLNDPKQIMQIIENVLKFSDLPISMKIRKGYTNSDTPDKLLQSISQEFGSNISWIAINRAPVKMGGVSIKQIQQDFSIWSNAVKSVRGMIPIVANGDINTYLDYSQIFNKTNDNIPSGLMIGRGALGYPQIFQEISKKTPKNIDKSLNEALNDFFLIMEKYLDGNSGRWTSFENLKKQLHYFIKRKFIENLQLPPGYGFSKWHTSKFSKTGLISKLFYIFPEISKKQWSLWFSHLQ